MVLLFSTLILDGANVFSQIHLGALWISNRHFRIYSIVYDTETEPFVYAEDLSSNGNNTWLYKREQCWESCLMSKGTTFLLSHRNKLRLCDGTMLIYYCDWISQKSASPEAVDELRKLEIEVSLHGSKGHRSFR